MKRKNSRKKRSERCQRTSYNVFSTLFADVRSMRVGCGVNLPKIFSKSDSGTRFMQYNRYLLCCRLDWVQLRENAPIFFPSTPTNSSILLLHKNSSILHSYGLNSTFSSLGGLREFYMYIYIYMGFPWDSIL